MKYCAVFVILLFPVSLSLASCSKHDPFSDMNNVSDDDNPEYPINNHAVNTMKITIGSVVFIATLYDNPSVTQLKKRLPLTVAMAELNSNEKYYTLAEGLPASGSYTGTIQNGDLMLYGSNTLVLFYKSFSTSYRYTRLGRIDNPEGLEAALGSGSITVTFELE